MERLRAVIQIKEQVMEDPQAHCSNGMILYAWFQDIPGLYDFHFFPDLLISSRISVKQTKDESIASKLVSELLGKKMEKNLWRPPEAHGLLNPLETPQASPLKWGMFQS